MKTRWKPLDELDIIGPSASAEEMFLGAKSAAHHTLYFEFVQWTAKSCVSGRTDAS